ncbi:MAG: response regulator [Anaerolineae bacterium]|nr:response regulator [Anaerolineae bacterium]
MSTQRILIVDDDPAVFLTLAASIERINPTYEVDTCENGAEALACLESHQYILLLTDYSMPGMSGIDLARVVREQSSDTHIIMMTAYGSDELRDQVVDLNLDAFVDKPFTVKKIREIISSILSRATDAPHVLVIEDNTDLRRLYSNALARAGYRVTETGVLAEAQHLVDQNKYAVLLCDIHMGTKKSTDMVREKRAKLTADGTHVVLITGESWYGDVVEEAGADLLLEKPVTLDTLIGLVGRLVTSPELQIEYHTGR